MFVTTSNLPKQNIYLIQTSDEETARKAFEGTHGRIIGSENITSPELSSNIANVGEEDTTNLFVFEDKDVYGFRIYKNNYTAISLQIEKWEDLQAAVSDIENHFPQADRTALKINLFDLLQTKLNAMKNNDKKSSGRDKVFRVLCAKSDLNNFKFFNTDGLDLVGDVTFDDILFDTFPAFVSGMLKKDLNVHFLFEDKKSVSIAHTGKVYQSAVYDFTFVSVPFYKAVTDYEYFNPPLENNALTTIHFVGIVQQQARQLDEVHKEKPVSVSSVPDKEKAAVRYLSSNGVSLGEHAGNEYIRVDLNKFSVENLNTTAIAMWLQRVRRVEFSNSKGELFIIQESDKETWMSQAYHYEFEKLEEESNEEGLVVIVSRRMRDERTYVSSVFFNEDFFEDAVVQLLDSIKA